MNIAAMKKAMKKHANSMVDIIALCILCISIGFVAFCAVVFIL